MPMAGALIRNVELSASPRPLKALSQKLKDLEIMGGGETMMSQRTIMLYEYIVSNLSHR